MELLRLGSLNSKTCMLVCTKSDTRNDSKLHDRTNCRLELPDASRWEADFPHLFRRALRYTNRGTIPKHFHRRQKVREGWAADFEVSVQLDWR